jgi:PAS domain S-box-containing protein
MAAGRQSFDDGLVGLFELSQDAFFIAGFDGYLKRANPAFPHSLGYTLEELLARPFVENIHSADRDSVEAVLAELAAGNPVVGFECRHICADGSMRWFEWSTSSRPEAGVVYGVGRDVTERQIANQELSALRHVATLAAEGVAPADLFAVVAEEVARVVAVPIVTVARYELDTTLTVCATFPTELRLFPAGTRLSLDGTMLSALVRDSSAAVRIDDYTQLDGEIAAVGRGAGARSTIGVPIVVAGQLWGVMAAWSRAPEPLPDDTAERLARFTELLAAAIANAQSREALERLAEQQAALRRIATLVARSTPPSEVFAAVADEMALCLGTSDAEVFRYDPDGAAVVVAAHIAPGARGLAVGERLALEGDSVAARVLRTGRPARMDGYDNAEGTIAARTRELGPRSRAGAPIVVDENVWGVALVGASAPAQLPSDIEARIAEFADLVATAIANTATRSQLHASQDELRMLAEQQAALRRVATLVARGVEPSEVFDAVTDEMRRCMDAMTAGLWRFETSGELTLLAGAAGDPALLAKWPVGTRTPVEGNTLASTVQRTGRPARMDDYANVTGSVAERVRNVGVRAAVGVPIIVDGRLWGLAAVGSIRPGPLPPDTEARMGDFADLVATSIANAATRDELLASRARIVAAADEARRRIERDLHDGAQQRLVALGLELRAAEACVPDELQPLKERIAGLVTTVAGVSAEVQEISRGLHPAILSSGGLGPALKALARRCTDPVDLDLHVDRRLPDAVEVGAYYVVAEALTNAAKHARASVVEVCAEATNTHLRLVIRDDGIGGAARGKGSGLTGLIDRVEALGGKITIQSQPGSGTSLLVNIPTESD